MDLSFCPVYGRGSCHSHDCDRWNTNDDSVSWSKGGREKENKKKKKKKEEINFLKNPPKAGEVIVPKKPEEWSKLSASDKIKVFEKEAQKCVNKGDFGAVISSDGTVNCREC